jgi:hypothetical protein
MRDYRMSNFECRMSNFEVRANFGGRSNEVPHEEDAIAKTAGREGAREVATSLFFRMKLLN